jgi:methyl-accepting chemotaxis protein
MRFAQALRLGAWFLIGLNLLMAFGSIWIFMRMAPAIEIIIAQNEVSLQACEEMLAALVIGNDNETDVALQRSSFSKALKKAENNITEGNEPVALERIRKSYIKAFAQDSVELKKTVDAILYLSAINREAMAAADRKAKEFGKAGAWGIVFMASAVFLVGILFYRSLKRNLSTPLEEIHSVTRAIRNGNTMRRCTGARLPREIKQIYSELNEILDTNIVQITAGSQKKDV